MAKSETEAITCQDIVEIVREQMMTRFSNQLSMEQIADCAHASGGDIAHKLWPNPRTDETQRPAISPDADGGATCRCGYGFSLKVWLVGRWECPRCGTLFEVTNGVAR